MRHVIIAAVAVWCLAVSFPSAEAVGPGEGEMTKYDVFVGNGCTVDSLTVRWELDSLPEGPTVYGTYKYVGDCGPEFGFVIWLRVEHDGSWGYVQIDPIIPFGPGTWAFNVTDLPNWDEVLCGYHGTERTECFSPSAAREIWENGRVTDFGVPWVSGTVVPNAPPTADAGPDQTVVENTVVSLSGSGTDSNGTIVRWGWTQTSGPTVMLSGAETWDASFTAPQVGSDENLVLIFRLSVTDDDGVSAADTVTITVGRVDDFRSSVAISGASGRGKGSNIGAGKESGEPDHAGNSGGASVWWTWTAPATGPVVFDTHGSDFDTLMAIYTGNNLNSLIEVASNDDTGGTRQSAVRFSAQRGRTYHVAVDGYNGRSGTIVLNWQAPSAAVVEAATDDFSPSVSIIGASGRSRGGNVGADTESGEPSHAGNSGGASVWWTWTAPATEPVVFDTRGSDFDTLLAIYTGNSLNDLTAVASNDDTDDWTLQSTVRFSAQQGQTYHIAVDGYGGATGTIVLNWRAAFVSENPDVTLYLSELTQDTSQGKVIIVEYEGPEFDEDDLRVSVGNTSVESSFVDNQIHLMLPLTESGETRVEFDFGDFWSGLNLDIVEAPALADPPSYVSGVVDDLVAELDALPAGAWGDEIDALHAAKQELSDLSAGEIRELAVFLKQNLEPLLRHLNSPVVAQFDEVTCEAEMRRFVFSRQAVTALIGGAVLYAFAPEPSKAIGLPLLLAGVVTGVVLIVDATEEVLDACLVSGIVDIQTDLDALLSFSPGSTAGFRGAWTAGVKVPQQASGTMSTIHFDEGQARAITLSLNRTFDPERKPQFVSAVQGLGDLLLKLNDGLRSVVGILPGFLSGLADGIESFIVKFDGFIATFAGLENPDRVETANYADFRLGGISDRNITGSITSANSDRLFLEFNFEDRTTVPQDGCVDFTYTLSNSRAGLQDATVPARLCASKGSEAAIMAGTSPVTEGTPAVFTVTFTPALSSGITLHYEVSQTGDYVSPIDLGTKTLSVPSGTATITLTVPTKGKGDEITEEAGTVRVVLNNADGYTTRDLMRSAEVMVSDADGLSDPNDDGYAKPDITLVRGATETLNLYDYVGDFLRSEPLSFEITEINNLYGRSCVNKRDTAWITAAVMGSTLKLTPHTHESLCVQVTASAPGIEHIIYIRISVRFTPWQYAVMREYRDGDEGDEGDTFPSQPAVCEEVMIKTSSSQWSLRHNGVYPPAFVCDPDRHGFWGDFECTPLSKCPRQGKGGCIVSTEDYTHKTFYYGIGYNCAFGTHDE